jgi:enoyl-[acyl-carrier protein] reductase/trans-2-enoyl-CoA reductase (NAD+)
MVIKPKVRGFICVTAHPTGCAAHVQQQIDHVLAKGPIKNGPKKVLVIGASTGFGLASRISAAFGSGAATLGVFFERPSEEGRTATPGWYNTIAFTNVARARGCHAKNINGDAFSDAIKQQTIDTIKAGPGQVDLVVYSLASPRRLHPRTGIVHKSCLKPIGAPYTAKTVDTDKGIVSDITLEPATEADVTGTIAVMGGEDWEMWIDALLKAGVLAPGATSVAFSYIGPEVTWPIYKNGAIGMAKIDLERAAKKIDATLKTHGYGRAFISINKALVTQASSAIPVVPLYISILYKIMKAKNLHEGCIEQMHRLFATQLYNNSALTFDDGGRVRIDNLEMRADVQTEAAQIWSQVTTETLSELTDIAGYRSEFMRLFGFGLPGVNYDAEVEPHQPMPE